MTSLPYPLHVKLISRLPTYLSLAAVCALVGYLLVAQLRSAQYPASASVQRDQQLADAVRNLQATGRYLQIEGSRLRYSVQTMEVGLARRTQGYAIADQELKSLEVQSATVSMQGPGINVIVANGTQPQASSLPGNLWLVNAEDIQDIINTLWASGAEAISVNGIRISPQSYYQAAGSFVLVDGQGPLSTPFRIRAIGDQGSMAQALSTSGDLQNLRYRSRALGIQFSWTTSRTVSIAGSNDPLVIRFAKPLAK